MDEQPDVRWAPLPPAPKRTGRVWLIVGLVVVALVIVGVLVFLLLPRDPDPAPTASPSPSTSATPTPTPTPSATPTGSASPEPTPVTTQPPVVAPSVEVFRDKVSGWLNDAGRGLDIVAGTPTRDALPVVDTLEQDAQRLGDLMPPTEIQDAWATDLATYAQRLADLRRALNDDSGAPAAVDAARSALGELRARVGL